MVRKLKESPIKAVARASFDRDFHLKRAADHYNAGEM
jgi:hypothetical protein